MIFQLAADLLLIFHLGFICFVVAGGFLVLKWQWLIFFHVPAAIWGALLEFNSWYCPLTTWENKLRRMAGQNGYEGGFIEHYLVPIIYPSGLTYEMQLVLGMIVIVCNVIAYVLLIASVMYKKQ